MAILEPPGVEAAVGDHDPMRDAEQFRVCELDARPRIAVIEQHFETDRLQVGVELLGGSSDPWRLARVERHHHDAERCQWFGPADPGGVVVLLDGGCNDPGDADAVAAHIHRHRFAGFVEDARLHRLAVLTAELEDVPDLDATTEGQVAIAARARVAGHHVAQVGRRRFGQVAAPVHTREMHVETVRSADEIGEGERCVVRIHRTGETARTEIPRFTAGGRDHRFTRGHAQGARDTGQLLRLDSVQLMVAA